MRNWLLGLTATMGLGGAAFGQSPPAGTVPPPPATFPTTGSDATFPVGPAGRVHAELSTTARAAAQPVSDLFLGRTPAVDYFFSVRPGVRASSRSYGAGFGVPTGGMGGSRAGYLPLQAATAEQGVAIPEAGVALPNNQLAPTGHPVSFGTGPGRTSPGTGAGRPGFTRGPVPPPGGRPGRGDSLMESARSASGRPVTE